MGATTRRGIAVMRRVPATVDGDVAGDPATPRWPRGAGRLRVNVDCDGTTHSIVWRRGALVLVDHDVAADEVIAALGGDLPPCLELLASWRKGYIETGPSGSALGLVRSLSSIARWMGTAASARPTALPEPLRRLREASVLHTWGRGLRNADAGGAAQSAFLERAIARRVRDLLVDCGTGVPTDAVEVVVARELDVDGTRLAVRASWLAEVWVPGLEYPPHGDGVVVGIAGCAGGETVLDVATWAPDSLDWTPRDGDGDRDRARGGDDDDRAADDSVDRLRHGWRLELSRRSVPSLPR